MSDIQFGIQLTRDFDQSPPYQRFQHIVELTKRARDGGFSSISLGQHYFGESRINWECFPILSRLLPEAGEMSIGTSVLLLPLHNPILIAEQAATVDMLSNGKLFLGLGLGFQDKEFNAFGVNKKDRVARFEEGIELMRKLWTQDDVTFNGKHFQVENLTTANRPIQKPTLPLWIAGLADGGVRRAARLGDSWLINPYVPLSALERQVGVYRKELQTLGKPFPSILPIRRDGYIAENSKQAWEGGEYLAEHYRDHILHSVHFKEDLAPDAQTAFDKAFQEEAKNRLLIGTPAEWIETVHTFKERTGTNHFILAWPGLSYEDTLKQIELVGTQVIAKLS